MLVETKQTDFEEQLRQLPDTWMERLHQWSSWEDERLRQAIDTVLAAEINSTADLIARLENEQAEDELRLAVCLVLGHLQLPEALPAFTRLLPAGNEEVRQAVCESLSLYHQKRLAIPLLREFKNRANSPELREEVAVAVGNLGSLRGISAFIKVLSSGEKTDTAGRKAAAVGLEAVFDARKVKINEPLQERMLIPLLACLEDETETLEVRVAAARTLYYFRDNRVVQRLLSLLSNTVPLELRQEVTRSLGGTRAEEAVKPLLDRLEDISEDRVLRQKAAWALAMIESLTAVPRLLNLMEDRAERTGEEILFRILAANTLGWLYSVEAVEPLIERLEDETEDDRVRSEAASALGMICDSRSLKPLIAALRDVSPEVRYSAVYALGQLGDERAVPHLEWVIANDDAELPRWGGRGKIRVYAQEALDTIKRGGG